LISDWAPPPDYLAVATRSCDADHAFVEVVGELDVVSSGQLADAVSYHLGRGRRYVTVDLAGVTFLDAGGISAFIRLHQMFLSAHGRLLFCNATRRVLWLLELLEVLDDLLVVDGEHRSLGIAT
jgi:anti-anti-sigma factor